jgi:hypothetical protein
MEVRVFIVELGLIMILTVLVNLLIIMAVLCRGMEG